MGAWWDRVISPVKRVWYGVATRLGMRKSGLKRLREEVSTCEYEDVQVMWEMLMDSSRRFGSGSSYRYDRATPAGKRKRMRRRAAAGPARKRAGKDSSRAWAVVEWARKGASFSFSQCRSL